MRASRARVVLLPNDRIPNKDFVLEYDVVGEKPEMALLTHRQPGSEHGYFMLMIQPKAELRAEEITPKEMIFVVDNSGLKSGYTIEKAKETFDEQQAEDAASRLLEGQFTLEDFLEQMAQVKKMGNLGSLMKLMPGMPKELRNQEIDDRELSRIEGIIHSMTTGERRDPKIIDGSRRLRIANGAGVTTSEVNALLKQFGEMQKMMKGLGGGLLGRAANKKAKKKKGKGGGRTTPKGGAKPKFTLPPPSDAGGAGGVGGLRLPGL